MNDQGFNSSPSMDLPKPQAEIDSQPQEVAPKELQAEAPAAIAIEQGSAPAVAPDPAIQIPSAALLPEPPVTSLSDPTHPLAQGHLPQIADDNDLIEKEWVIKAKEIVEKTKHDPHLQNQEISKVKANYLKKRYNKDLKVSGE
jgi:hypothetical protein